MVEIRKIRRLVVVWGVFVAASIAGPLVTDKSWSLAAEVVFPDGVYPYSLVEQDLAKVLQEFGQNLGLRVQLSPRIQGSVKGRLPRLTAREFLDYICRTHNLDWYYDGYTMYVFLASESITRMVRFEHITLDQFIATLKKTGFHDPRYPINPGPDPKSGIVTGPPRYIVLIEQSIQALNSPQEPPVAAVLAMPSNDTGREKTVIYRGGSESTVEFGRDRTPIR